MTFKLRFRHVAICRPIPVGHESHQVWLRNYGGKLPETKALAVISAAADVGGILGNEASPEVLGEKAVISQGGVTRNYGIVILRLVAQ